MTSVGEGESVKTRKDCEKNQACLQIYILLSEDKHIEQLFYFNLPIDYECHWITCAMIFFNP